MSKIGSSRSGFSVNRKKLKKVAEKMPVEFTSRDVKNELDRYRALRETPSSTISKYIHEMLKLGYATHKENRGVGKKQGAWVKVYKKK